MQTLPEAFAALGDYRQFICWKAVPDPKRPGKVIKKPADPRTGDVWDAHDHTIWVDWQTACKQAELLGPAHGVGFVFTELDPFWFVDIDSCLTSDGWSPLAVDMLTLLAGAAVEVSTSGRGLHVIGSGWAPLHACKNSKLGIEFYTSKRFVALTGTNAGGSAGADLSAVLPHLVETYFPGASAEGAQGAEWTDKPVAEWKGPEDDKPLLDRALRSHSARSIFGQGASFLDLWEGNLEVLGRAYPDTSGGGRAYDASSADAALAQHLAFWTGKNCDRVLRLMWQSGLKREKWNREDYLIRTIQRACSRQEKVLTDQEPAPRALPMTDGTTAPQGTLMDVDPFLSGAQQQELFQGCVYVTDVHRGLVPGGVLLKPDQFKVAFGGYSFFMDRTGEKVSKDAWEAFTQSQILRSPRTDTTCFRPALPPAVILQEPGRTAVNTWWPVDVPRTPGDVRPFLGHLEKLVPDERDRLILLSYMAACVQHKGVKFRWAPLIQGCEGNGKTILTVCVAEAIGWRYVHLPPPKKLGNQFNSWLPGRVLVGIEDVYAFDSKTDIMEELKVLITGERQEVEMKGVDQRMADICANFILNTNHKDAIRKTRNDRRIAPFFTAQQSVDDLKRDGMDETYFARLDAWLKRGDGYAIVSELLHTYPIPHEFNPAFMARAPETSSTGEMIEASMGSVEQEIIETAAQGVVGFKGGWVSSHFLDHLLDNLGYKVRISQSRRVDMMKAIGYVLHPGLGGGRAPSVLMPDGVRPRLFIRKGHPDEKLRGEEEIARRYSAAQGVGEGVHK